MEAALAYELGLDPYGGQVTFEAFEEKILTAQRDARKRDEFRQMLRTFEAERAAKALFVKRAITVAGVAYIVWRIALWL